ncbi:hybrid sensor histidine kinase/response regulator transcription factor [Spirosoma pulveris]
MNVQRITLALLLWAAVPRLFAQTFSGINRILSTADGLPSSTITGLVQDRAGFIWMATADGLARYDGRNVRIFRQDDQPNALLENNIAHIQLLSNGTFLLQTRTGDFQKFDPVTERFSLFFPLARQGKRKIDDGWLAPDGKTFWGLWRGEKIQYFDQKLHSTYRWDQRTLGIAANTLHSMIVASSGLVYAHSDKGLIVINPHTRQHRLLPFAGPVERRLNTLTPVVDWAHVVERPSGDILVIGQHCLHVFNPTTRQFREVVMPGPFAPNGAYALRVLADGKVYLGIGQHLYELLPNDQFATVYTGELPIGEQRAFGIPYICDRTGIVWLYDQAGKLTLLNQRQQPFRTYPYRTSWTTDLLQTGLGMEPVQTIKNSDSWTRLTPFRGSLWFIDQRTLYRYNIVRHRPEQTSSFIINDTCHFKIALKPDQHGHLWVYGNERGGLTEIDSVGHVKRYWPNSLVPQPLENRGLDVADIQPMGQTIWMASYQGKGLYQYDLRQKKIIRQWLHIPGNTQSLPTNQLLGLLADPREPNRTLWLGTLGRGLIRFDTQTGQFRTFTVSDGLPDNTINSLQTDHRGFIWVATNKGLVRLDAHSFRMRVFTRSDGLQDDEFVFAAATQLPDGRLAFGSKTGMTVFNPSAIREQTSQTPVVLSALRINNELVEANKPSSPLTSPVNALTTLTLSHKQNFLTFEFAGLAYAKPDQIHYRHRLLGVDQDWVTTGTNNSATYTQLRPGNYVFEVMATNADGRWSHNLKQLAIRITPPWWASWWAYIVYTLTFGVSLAGFIRFRIKQRRQLQEIDLRKQEAAQLKIIGELKTRFFDNITHEFRTPLSLILSPTEKLLDESKHDTITRQRLETIRRNGNRLLHLVNQLLDLSKLEAGSMTVTPIRCNIAQFMNHLIEPFRPVAEERGIELILLVDECPQDYLLDTDKWGTILTNLLSNALKFTSKGGRITAIVSSPDEFSRRILISDTGIGISADKLPHIFDRFYQVDDTQTRAYDGTGIGLALVKEYTRILGGSIYVSSQPAVGTTFTLLLPVLPALPNADAAPATTTLNLPDTLAYIHDRSLMNMADSPTDSPVILVVEDNVELRDFIASELYQSYRVLIAQNGEEGWELAKSELPDVVISDVMMPKMDGYALTRHLKTNTLTNHIAVLLLTARASQESRMDGLRQGADDYLTKPFHVNELQQRIHNLLSRQQALRAFYGQQFAQPNALLPTETLANEFVHRLHEAIDLHLSDSTFGVEEMARHMGVSRRTLHRKLTATVNLSANEVIRQHRLKRAAQLLLAGHNVSETAYLVGYESSAHFSLIFKEFFQKTPTEYTQQ